MNFVDKSIVLCKDGSIVMPYKNVLELLSDNKVILNCIKNSSHITPEIYSNLIDPLIYRFAKIVSIAPASKCLHDCDCGGLLRHCLLVALKAVEISNFSKFEFEGLNRSELQVLLIFLALIHDMGKVFSDIVFSCENREFKYSLEKLDTTLDDFLASRTNHKVKVNFNKSRNKVHENSIIKAIPFLLYKQSEIGKILALKACKKAINAVVMSDAKDDAFRLIKVADVYACKTSINQFSPLYEIGNYLKLLFSSGLINTSENGFYRINGGYVVERGSLAYQSILNSFDYYYAILDECNSFSDISHSSFENMYSSCQESVLYNEDSKQLETVIGSNFNLPRKSFFVELSDSNFIIQGAYKRSCIWRELYNRNSIKFVYGFIICFDFLAQSSSVYKIIDELDVKDVKNIISNNHMVSDNIDIDKVSSFSVVVDKNDDYQVVPGTLTIDTFSSNRVELLASCARKRARNKTKEKNKLSRDISSLQKELQEKENNDFLQNYEFFY